MVLGHKLELRSSYFGGLFVLIFLLFLNGCSTTTLKDGPPDCYVDVSKIHDATPCCEPYSKYGNMTCYRVAGKNYYVMKSAKHYKERGVASWYGRKFNKQRTSSGERYNMLGMTAAHKTLPLPTYVRVTNLTNGRKVIVKVNDRGPFAENRLIDLSYVAAKKLGMIGHGTATVEVEAIDPSEKNRTQIAYSAKPKLLSKKQSKKSLYFQVAAFKNKLHAEQLKNKLIAMTTLPIEVSDARSAKDLYRVKIGPIKDLATYNEVKKKFKSMGSHSQVNIAVIGL